jgi:KRAB domain-containing zinc finger protein
MIFIKSFEISPQYNVSMALGSSVIRNTVLNKNKPYKCDKLGKVCSQNHPLQTHIKTHTGDKPYKCDIFGKVFSQNGNLQNHIGTHTGDKAYTCDICGQMLSQKHNIQYLAIFIPYRHTLEHTLVINHINVIYVVKCLVRMVSYRIT